MNWNLLQSGAYVGERKKRKREERNAIVVVLPVHPVTLYIQS
jgi:hypothetical protein